MRLLSGSPRPGRKSLQAQTAKVFKKSPECQGFAGALRVWKKTEGKLVLLTVRAFRLQLSFFAYSPLRRLLEALSHCKYNPLIVSKKALTVSKKTSIVSKKSTSCNKKAPKIISKKLDCKQKSCIRKTSRRGPEKSDEKRTFSHPSAKGVWQKEFDTKWRKKCEKHQKKWPKSDRKSPVAKTEKKWSNSFCRPPLLHPGYQTFCDLFSRGSAERIGVEFFTLVWRSLGHVSANSSATFLSIFSALFLQGSRPPKNSPPKFSCHSW